MRNELQRFTIVCPPPLETVGGIQTYTGSLARELAALGFVVRVVTSSYIGGAEAAAWDETFAIERIPSLPAVDGRFPIPIGVASLTRSLRHALAGTDTLVVQARFYPLSLAFATVARAFGREVLVVDHGSAHVAVDRAAADAIIAAYEHLATAWLRLLGVRFGAVSTRSVAWLRHFGIEAARIVPNGIGDALFEQTAPRHTAGGRLVVAYCGRLLQQKGVLELIDAIGLLRSEGRDCTLTIAGDGPLEAAVRDRVRNTPFVRFAGRLTRDEVLAVLRDANAVVLPSSRAEGAPSIILEAAATGAAVVATQAGDGAGLIDDGETGVLIPDASATSIASALRRLHDEPGLASRLAPNLRDRVRAGFTWRAIALELARSTAV